MCTTYFSNKLMSLKIISLPVSVDYLHFYFSYELEFGPIWLVTIRINAQIFTKTCNILGLGLKQACYLLEAEYFKSKKSYADFSP